MLHIIHLLFWIFICVTVLPMLGIVGQIMLAIIGLGVLAVLVSFIGIIIDAIADSPAPKAPEPAPQKKWSQFVREVLGELSDGRLTVLVIVLTIFGVALLTDRQFMAEVKTEWYRWFGEAAVEETVHPRELSAELTTDPHQYPVDSRFSIIP